MEKLDLLVLADLGLRMRNAQKAYFKSRTKEALIESKTLESEFDKTIGRIFQEQGTEKGAR